MNLEPREPPEVDVELLHHLRGIGDDLSFRGWILYYLASGWNRNALAEVVGISRETVVAISTPPVSRARWQKALQARQREISQELVRYDFERNLELDLPK